MSREHYCADYYNVFLYLQDQELLTQIDKRVLDAGKSDQGKKLQWQLLFDCKVVELAGAMLRDHNERQQMAERHLPMPAITHALMKVGYRLLLLYARHFCYTLALYKGADISSSEHNLS